MTTLALICRHSTGTATALSVMTLLLASAAPVLAQQLDLDALAQKLDRIEGLEPAPDGQAAAAGSGPAGPLAPAEPVAPMHEPGGATGPDTPAEGAASYRFPADAAELAAYSARLLAEREVGPRENVFENTCQMLVRFGRPEVCNTRGAQQ